MGRFSKNIPADHKKHPRPVTRREMLAQGLLSSFGYAVMPSLLSMFHSRLAFGEELMCAPKGNGSGGGAALSRVPFLMLDLAGGAGLSANFAFTTIDGMLLPDSAYRLLGYQPADTPNAKAPDVTYKGTFFQTSGVLRGLNAVIADPAMRQKVTATGIASTLADDITIAINPLHLIGSAGGTGQLATVAGNQQTVSGTRSLAPQDTVKPSFSAAYIRNPQDALSLISPGTIATILGDNQALVKVLEAAKSMSAANLKKFSEMDLSMQLKTLVECNYLDASKIAANNSPEKWDASRDPQVTANFTMTNADEASVGTLTKLLLEGGVGAAGVTLSGFDYHNGTATTGDQKDELVGRLVGKAFQLAAAKGQSMMIFVATNGSVAVGGSPQTLASGAVKYPWVTDRGEAGAALMFVYNHKQAAGDSILVENNRTQVGGFTAGAAVDPASPGNGPDKLVQVVTANYMALHGEADAAKFQKVVGTSKLGADFEKSILFKKII